MGKSVDRKQVDEIKNDTISKDFWRNNEHFADLFSAVLFGGEHGNTKPQVGCGYRLQ